MYGELSDRPPQRPDRARTVVRNIGELLITAGLVVLLFVVYEVYITDLLSAGKQREATAALDDQWNNKKGQDTVDGGERTNKYDLEDGKGFAKLYLPSLGADVHFTVLEGTSDKTLESGPGHYKGTALPGQPGNFAIAGHRVGMGAPFNDLDLLRACDAIVIETQTDWFVYRMLPMQADVAKWATKQQGNPRCANVNPLGGSYSKVFGQEIVLPTNGSVISPVPGQAGSTPPADQAALMTLTTCHPKFSDRQRLIVHAVLIKQWKKDPTKADTPPELKEQN
ncbi:LPXTG-site transpeptidase (sortase) family protein [Actinocrispum wychmicini]|uniref:LPXTG-site transpeptidase (Sortase) family protein n=2 Tax=Actinocrispum wychmicini TaxID=1213861 RepID=A0A4R2JVY5_9PSEU|nr:LPXTG-site transpeptidase (sortase) family protein [Actinocrispum wychmicini]